MATQTKLSGFPEWLPGDRIVEERIIDRLKHLFELHGFTPIHTRAVETLDTLAKDGEIDKEIFALHRLHESSQNSTLGLHFDLTVPLSRYIVENAGRLAFPFKSYRIQPVWRGERPQDGRFREFIQADIDVIAEDTLAEHYEIEVPLVFVEAFNELAELGVPPIRIVVNNRKIVEGFARGLGVEKVTEVLRCLDKLDKIGPEAVAEELAQHAGATTTQQRQLLALASIESDTSSFADEVLALGVDNPLLIDGVEALTRVVDAASAIRPGSMRAQLKIARGLDYYTGTVYETQLLGHESLGSIASGGRYDTLVSNGKTRYPGVGMSLGVSRLMSRLVGKKALVQATRPVPTAVLVAVSDESTRHVADATAQMLRSRGIPTEVAPTAAKFGKQIRFADRRSIPFVWFPESPAGHEVKDIRSGEQVLSDPEVWVPPAEDLWPEAVRIPESDGGN